MILVLGDLHLGLKDNDLKIQRLEQLFKEFNDIEILILLGDIFDFYFECPEKVKEIYGPVLRLFETKANHFPIFYLQGNHDFFPLRLISEMGIKIISKDFALNYSGKKIYFTHGDLLTLSGRVTRTFLTFSLRQKMAKLLPCELIYSLASRISRWSRKRSQAKPLTPKIFRKIDDLLKESDIVVTAHLHNPIIEIHKDNKIYANPGDWIKFYTFLTLQNSHITLWKFEDSLIVKEKEVKI